MPGVIQVIIDDSTDKTVTGHWTIDSAAGGAFTGAAGASFPSTPTAGEWFWRTDENKLYRRSDANDSWTAVSSTVAVHATTHQPGGSDAMAVDALAGTGSLRTLGTAATSACAGNDSRLSDSRTPTSHAASHKHGGADEVATATPAANAIPKADGASKVDSWVTANAVAGTPSLRQLGTGATDACAGNDSRLSDARTPTAHATSHNAGGGDALAIDAAAGTGSLRTLGTGATSACAGNDSRLSDTRTPTAHATSHKSGGTDSIKLDELAACTDVTTLNVSTTAHGLTPKLPNVATQYLNGVGGWTTPAGSSSVFGSDYQTAISTARSTTTSSTMQDKTTLTTGALTGTYRVGWTSVIDTAAANKEVQAQLYNVTDAAVIGAVQDQRPSSAAPKMHAGGFAEVVFAGAAKTFKIQFKSVDGSTTVGIQNARIEFWRVS